MPRGKGGSDPQGGRGKSMKGESKNVNPTSKGDGGEPSSSDKNQKRDSFLIGTNKNSSLKAVKKGVNPRKRRTSGKVNKKFEDEKEKKAFDPDFMYRSKIPPSNPEIGYGFRYNPNDPNCVKPVTVIFCTNIGEATENKLRAAFLKFGPIKEAKITDGKFSSFAHIKFVNSEDALKALKGETYLKKRKVKVLAAHQKHQPVPDNIDKLAAIVAPDACYVDKLNDDCLRHIFSYFNIFERTALEIVSKRWHRLIKDLWLVVRELNFNEYPLLKLFRSNALESTTSNMTTYQKLLQYTARNLLILTVRNFNSNNSMSVLKTIKDNCKCLESLTLVKFHVLDLSHLSKGVDKLKHMGLVSSHVDDDKALKVIKEMKQLESFEFRRHLGHITLSDHLFKMKRLRIEKSSLNLCQLENFLSNNSKTLKQFSFIRSTVGETDENFLVKTITERAPQLEELEISNFNSYNEIDLSLIYKLSHLKKLCLNYNASVSHDVLIKIARNCKQLEHVELDYCTGLTTEALVALGKLPKLSSLSLNNTFSISNVNLQDDALIQFVNSLVTPSNFKHLFCMKCSLTDEAFFAVLTICTKLETLDISHCAGVTEATLMTAEEAVLQRNNDVVLSVNIFGTCIPAMISGVQKKYPKNLVILEKDTSDRVKGVSDHFMDLSDDSDTDYDDDDDDGSSVDIPLHLLEAYHNRDPDGSDDDYNFLYIMAQMDDIQDFWPEMLDAADDSDNDAYYQFDSDEEDHYVFEI